MRRDDTTPLGDQMGKGRNDARRLRSRSVGGDGRHESRTVGEAFLLQTASVAPAAWSSTINGDSIRRRKSALALIRRPSDFISDTTVSSACRSSACA